MNAAIRGVAKAAISKYDIKVIGRQTTRFEAMVQGIVTRHIETRDLLAVTRRLLESSGLQISDLWKANPVDR